MLVLSLTSSFFFLFTRSLGGGHRSYSFFPEKLNVSVSLTPQVMHKMPSVAGVSIFN